jgi:hypothetical protein
VQPEAVGIDWEPAGLKEERADQSQSDLESQHEEATAGLLAAISNPDNVGILDRFHCGETR